MLHLDVLQTHLKFIEMNLMDFVRPKVGAKHELLFNKPTTTS
jgi:hypothetical protein